MLRRNVTGGVSVTRNVRSPRERVARALCDLHGHPSDIKMDGQPMWVSYFREVDAALSAATPGRDWTQPEERGAVDQKRIVMRFEPVVAKRR